MSAPGGPPAKLCEGCLRATDWSRDEMAVLVFGDDPYQISVLDVASRQRTPLVKHPDYDVLYGRLSPDNRWLSFTARVQPARGRIVVAPIDGAKPVPESAWLTIAEVEPDDYADWSPDGKTLYFTSGRDGYSCLGDSVSMRVPVDRLGNPSPCSTFTDGCPSITGAGRPPPDESPFRWSRPPGPLADVARRLTVSRGESATRGTATDR
jgi:Tol biopolymer transport system component